MLLFLGLLGGAWAGPLALPLMTAEPVYSEQMRERGARGRVVLSVLINASGRADDIQAKSSPDPELTHSAIEALRRWRFLPRIGAGEPRESRVEIPLVFEPPPTREPLPSR